MKQFIIASLIAILLQFSLVAKDKTKAQAEKEMVDKQRIKELDAYWDELERCVGEGDWQGFLKTVHPEAILVSGVRNMTMPMTKVMVKWKKEFDDTKAGKIKASVVFRFNKRLGDDKTAHETGMFLYKQTNAEGKKIAEYINFKGLLIKKNGVWVIMMENQEGKGSKEDWDKLPKR